MKLLFINQYYWPDMAATAQMLTDLCEHLARAGHEVSVLCSRGGYDPATGAKTRQPRRERRRGVVIHRVAATGFAKRSVIGRIFDYLSFHVSVGLRTLLTAKRHDVLVTLTTPPLVGLHATIARLFCRTKHVCWVMDLHPDCEFELGLFNRGSLLPRGLDYLNGMHFRRADACVVLGPYMAERLRRKRVGPAKLHTIDLWGHDVQEAAPGASSPSLRDQWDLAEKFVVMYSGNAGLIHTFDAVLEAARRLRDDDRFAFLFVGGGRRMSEVEAFKQQHGLANIRIRPYCPRQQLAESLALGDVHLVTLREGMAGVALPSKIYGILAAGRPALFIGPEASEPAETIVEHDCGRVLNVDDVEGLTRALDELARDGVERDRLGRNARRAFEDHYRAAMGCEKWRQLLESL